MTQVSMIYIYSMWGLAGKGYLHIPAEEVIRSTGTAHANRVCGIEAAAYSRACRSMLTC